MNFFGIELKAGNHFYVEKRVMNCPIHGKYEAQIAICGEQELGGFCPHCMASKTEEQKRKEFVAKCKAANIEPEYYDYTLDSFIPKSETQKQAKEAVAEMIKNKHGKVVLLGKNGVGKSMLASVAAKELGGKIYTMYEISAMIRQSYTVKAERSELDIVNELASIPFLAIDEMGRTKGSETEHNWLSFILDKRHTRRLPFMLLTNAHFAKDCPENGCPKCFENFIDSDVLSRLQEDSRIIVVEADDIRKVR